MDFKQPFRSLKDLVESTGSPSVSHLVGTPLMLFGTPDHVRELLAAVKEKAASTRRSVSILFGSGSILALPYSRWLPLRRNLGQVFHLTNMKGYFEVYVESALDFVARVEAHNSRRKRHFEEAKEAGMRTQPTTLLEPIDVDMCAMDLALDVVTRALFSKDLAIQRGGVNKLADTIHTMTHLFIEFSLNPVFWLIHPFQYWTFHSSRAWFHRSIADWVRERQADPNAADKHDLLSLMLKVRDPETGDSLTTEVIGAQCTTFYLAGHDTTAHTIAWALHEIAQHPEVEEKIFEELTEVIGDRGTPTYEEANKLTYLQWVVKETLRLHPPVGVLSRCTMEKTEFAGVAVPANCSVTVSLLAVHYSEQVWPEPWRFRPERFSDQESAGRSPYAWLPFSQGERNCIGMNFALMEIRVVLAVLCKKFRLAPSVDLLPHTGVFISTAPVDGLFIHFLPRDN